MRSLRKIPFYYLLSSASNAMSKKLAVFNMKGGVGKTTTAYNLAVGLVKFHSAKVLLVDEESRIKNQESRK